MCRFTILQESFKHNYINYTAGVKQRYKGMRTAVRRQREHEVFLPYTWRKYDISYVGTINNGSTRELYGVNAHRQNAVNAIERLQQKYPDLRIYTMFVGKMKYNKFIDIVKGLSLSPTPSARPTAFIASCCRRPRAA
jgi:hypothetical protein